MEGDRRGQREGGGEGEIKGEACRANTSSTTHPPRCSAVTPRSPSAGAIRANAQAVPCRGAPDAGSHHTPARPTSAGDQRLCACHPLLQSSGGSAAPLERAREKQKQEAGPLRLTSARVARAHAQAVGCAGEHFFYASTDCLRSYLSVG